jgi:hypothetical protein
MRCNVFDPYRIFWGSKLSYIEEMAPSTSETFVFMYPSYVPLHFNTDRHENLKRKFAINPLTPGLNPSAQRCLTKFLLGILLLEPCISLIYAWKPNKYINYSLILLIMYGSSYMFQYYTAILRERS